MTDESGDRGTPAAGGDIDRMLAEMGMGLRRAAPTPGARLVERVLGDAAEVAAERTAEIAARQAAEDRVPPAAPKAPEAAAWTSLIAGWLTGPRLAAAVLSLSLLGGVGTGYALGPTEPVAEFSIYASDPAWDFDDEDTVLAMLF